MTPVDWARPFSSLAGKRAIVTGASRGIGRAIAEGLCAVGANVVITGRKEDSLQAAAAELSENKTTVVPVVAHSRDRGDLARVADAAATHLGGIDLLVNNVAVSPSLDPLHEMDEEMFNRIMQTNLNGYLALTQLAVKQMPKGSSVVNVSSVGGLAPAQSVGAYAVSKAAVNMLTRQMGMELAHSGIRVNAVAPGVIATRFSAAYWDSGSIEHAAPPVGRWGHPDDVAAVVLFLLSDLAAFITGEIVVIDGGATLT